MSPLTQRAMGDPMNPRARWSVFFIRKGKMRRRKFNDDFGAALRFYTERVGTSGLTLHCDNIGFPAPRHITHAEREDWEKYKRLIKGKYRKRKRRIKVVYNKMEDYNRKGIWWCPYCIKLRRFKEVETDRGIEMCCPVCWSSNYIVRDYNPLALNFEIKAERRTRVKAPKEKRARRQR